MANCNFGNYLESLGSKKFRELWPAQQYVLDAYSRDYLEKRDIGIELPTGAGKTLIALLIAGKWLKSKKKAVILSANKTLARQMKDEAENLGLPVAYMEGRGEDIPVRSRRAYQRAQQIGIMNYWVYFNQNPVVDPAALVVMDDKDFGVYFLADQRFATHFSRESNREGIPQHIMAEIDLAQDLSEREDVGLATYVAQFLKKNFEEYDADLSQLAADIPQPQKPENSVTDTSKDEVIGWTALFESENYAVAQDHFERCWDRAKNDNLLEIAALHGWHRAKALYLDGLRGQQGASDRAIQVLEEAIKRGGQSSWFNRMRASISRMYAHTETLHAIAECEFAEAVIRSFDDELERLGVSGNKYQKFINDLNEKLGSEKHATYQEGLETLGTLLGYKSSRPKNKAAADCIWCGNFGNTRELFTFETKIEQQPSNSITASNLGQASLQYNRAMEEYGNKGYVVHSLIATHLEQIAPEGMSAIGQIKLVSKDTVLALWACVRNLMTIYRSRWNLDVIQMRRAAEIEIRPKLPKTGWFLRAVDSADPWLSENMLLKEWNE